MQGSLPVDEPMPKPRRPRRTGVVTPLPGLPGSAEALLPSLPGPILLPASAEIVEAVASPAIESDSNPSGPIVAGTVEGSTEMATIASPAEVADKAQAAFGDVQGRMKAAYDRSSKLGEEMLDFARGNVEAVMASARAAAKASEVLGTEAADYGKKSFEHATATFKSFTSVKSPTELFQLQGEFAKTSFDSAVAEASKLSEAMMKFAGEIAQPLSNRYALAAEKIKSTVA
jgi:phasin family protein